MGQALHFWGQLPGPMRIWPVSLMLLCTGPAAWLDWLDVDVGRLPGPPTAGAGQGRTGQGRASWSCRG